MNILRVLDLKPEGVRYSELEKALGDEFTPPTLSNHLKNHLVKWKIVDRKIDEDTRNTTYKINYDKITTSRKYIEWEKKRKKDYIDNVEFMFSLPVNEQITMVGGLWFNINLYKLKSLIEYMADKTNTDKRYAVLMWNNPKLLNYDLLIANKCMKDELYRKEVLKNIDNFLVEGKGGDALAVFLRK
jgi:DNA-binding transcriptional ArsR family regulator